MRNVMFQNSVLWQRDRTENLKENKATEFIEIASEFKASSLCKFSFRRASLHKHRWKHHNIRHDEIP